jgi:flagellar assembly protein FliH
LIEAPLITPTRPAPHRSGARPAARVLRQPAATMTAAAFLTVGELAAEVGVDEFRTGLSEHDRKRLDEMAERGYHEGFVAGGREGYEAGREQATREVTARAALAIQALGQAAAQLLARDAVTLAELDGQVADFAVDVVAELLGRELQAVADPGAAAIARAVALVPSRGDLVARLHPADVALLGDVTDLTPGRPLTIVADAGVEQGGCVVDVGPCRIDAQIGAALDRVKLVLSVSDPSGRGSGGDT